MYRLASAVMRGFLREESAASAVEYGVMLALIIVASITSIVSVGRKFADIYDVINNAVPQVTG